MASSSSLPLPIPSYILLLLLTTSILLSAAADISIHDILPRYGIPRGVIPDSVTNYSFNPQNGIFQVEIGTQPCYVELDNYLISYHHLLTGTLKLGSITNLKGLQMKRLLFWLDVDQIKVDLPPNRLVYFQVGLLNKKLQLDLLNTLHTCTSRNPPAHPFSFPTSSDLVATH